jgi:tetratricopeptide (TPR) repeat protein
MAAACAVLLTVSGARGAEPAGAAEAPLTGPPTPVPDGEADRHAMLGERLLARGQAQEAIAEFRRAYELRAEPRYLFDIAEGYRQLGLRDQALFFYQRYLSAAPDASDRDEVEEQIAALERPAKPAPRAIAPSLAHDVVIVPVSAPRPIWKRWWFWTAVGAAVVGGTVAAFAVGSRGADVPPTALGDQKFY